MIHWRLTLESTRRPAKRDRVTPFFADGPPVNRGLGPGTGGWSGGGVWFRPGLAELIEEFVGNLGHSAV